MRKLLTKLGKPADLNLATIVKIISDWASFLKKISPFASTLFILLNLGTLLKKKASVITLLILVPLLIITRKPEVLRVIFSIALFWIFLEKFSSGIGKMDRRLAVFLCLYALVIFGCIFDPWLYLMMYDGSFRYRFILESHNALCILVFMIFIYLLETLLDTIPRPGRPWHRPLLVVSICALILVFLFIKSRLYIGMTFAFLCIVAFKRWRQMRILLLLPIVYAGVFIAITLFSRQAAIHMDPTVVEKLEEKMMTRDSLLKADTTRLPKKSEIAAALVMNQRLTNFSTTGRMQLIEAFGATFQHFGWQHFIYSNNVENYLAVKRRIPYINLSASSLTENAYLTMILSSGLVGLLLLLYMSGTYINYFIRRKQLFSLAFFLLLMAVWVFEETTIFTFSLMAQLFALSSINRIEKEDHESSIGN